jgi:hypothetical protein
MALSLFVRYKRRIVDPQESRAVAKAAVADSLLLADGNPIRSIGFLYQEAVSVLIRRFRGKRSSRGGY